jgi:hypothetical protein
MKALPTAVEERFDKEFAVIHYEWGQKFAWADVADETPERIKAFIATELERQAKVYEEKIEDLEMQLQEQAER